MKTRLVAVCALLAGGVSVGSFLARDRGLVSRARGVFDEVREELGVGEGEGEENEAKSIMMSARWWKRQRGGTTGIPKGAQQRGSDDWDHVSKASLDAPRKGNGPHLGNPPTYTWQSVGPTVVNPLPLVLPNVTSSSGRVNTIAIDPTNPKIIYAGTSYGGVWKSTTGGTTWTSLTDTAATLAIGSIAIDPANSQTIYVGTGSANAYDYAGVGVLKSVDGGATWTTLGAKEFTGYAISKIVVDSPSGYLYVSSSQGKVGEGFSCEWTGTQAGQGFWRSKDGGATFESVLLGLPVNDFNIDPASSPRKIFVSQDTFHTSLYDEATGVDTDVTVLPKNPIAPRPNTYTYTRAPSNSQIVWAAVSYDDPTNQSTLHRSIDNGATFTTITAPDYCTEQCDYDNVVTVSPADPNIVWLGGSLCSTWLSTNAMSDTPKWRAVAVPGETCNGNQWAESSVHPDAHSIVFSGTDVYFGTDGGVTLSHDNGATFVQLNQGLNTLQYYNLCLDETDTSFYMGAAQDNGIQQSTTNGAFAGISGGDGVGCALSGHNKGGVLLDQGLVQLYNGGFTFQTSFDAGPGCNASSPGCGDISAWAPPFITDPTSPDTLYIGTQRVWKSTNGGNPGSWKAISGNLTRAAGAPCTDGIYVDTLASLAVAPSKGTTIYSGSDAGVLQRSFDGGATWAIASGLPLRWITGIAVDPHDDRSFFVGFSGFPSANAPQGHVFHSADGGGTFQLVDIPMDTPVDCVTTHGTRSGVAFVGTDFGVFATADNGATWQPLSSGLPKVPVMSIKYRKADDTIAIATYGRGIWKLPLAGTLDVSPVTLNLTAVMGTMSAPGSFGVGTTSTYGAIIPFAVTTQAPWLTATQGAPSAAADIPVSVVGDATTLAVGGYDSTATVTPSDGTSPPMLVSVHLTVTSAPIGTGGSGGSAGSAGSAGNAGANALGGQGGVAGSATAGAAGSGGKAGSSGAHAIAGSGGMSGTSGSGGGAPQPSVQPVDDASGGCGCRTSPSMPFENLGAIGGGLALLLAGARRRKRAASLTNK